VRNRAYKHQTNGHSITERAVSRDLYACYVSFADVLASQLAQSPIHSGHVPTVSTRFEGSARRLPDSSEDSENRFGSNRLPLQKRLEQGSHSHQRLAVVAAVVVAAVGVVEVASGLAVAVAADVASSVDAAATSAAADEN
jgi:hypothetical protein